jgi:hypothetical protein
VYAGKIFLSISGNKSVFDWAGLFFIRDVSMQIIAQCPFCGCTWLLEDIAADRRMRCRKCRRLFKVPKLDEVPKAVKVINHSKGTIYVDQNGKTYG